jgi:feruloyl esterase
MAIPAASIGLPSSGGAVSTAVVTAPSGSGATAIPEYCLVNGSISPVDSTAPKILFRVALPTVWNGKAVMFGGGGFNGTIPSLAGNVPNGPTNQPTPLGRATRIFASDPATRRTPRLAGGSPFVNDEAVRNPAATRSRRHTTRRSS